MLRRVVQIAKIVVESDVVQQNWAYFLIKKDCAQENMLFSLTQADVPYVPLQKRSLQDIFEFSGKTADIQPLPNGDWLMRNPMDSHALPIRCSPDYREAKIYCPDESCLGESTALDLMRLPVECSFIYHSIVSLHAACVDLQGKALCFTGDSGIGKSTRALAWRDALGAEFISGDRPAIRLEKYGATACGVPWDGKEQIFRNIERPLCAIMEVRRAPFTRIRALTPEQAFRVLIRQSFVPMWDADTAALAMVNVHALCRKVRVYRLFCGPDNQSAAEAEDILFHNTQLIKEELPEMQIKQGFVLRTVAGEHMVMPTGENIGKFGGAVVLSDVAAFIFEQLRQPISREDLLDLVLGEYDVDAASAGADLDELIEQFRSIGILEE